MKFITDRTEADVLLGTPKGYYSYEDLNRVEQAVEQLAELAKRLDKQLNLSCKTDWGLPGQFSADTWPTASQMQRYISNIHTLCDCFAPEAALPATMEHLNWQGANDIEKGLHFVYCRVIAILNTFNFSGEMFAGEENVL